MPKYASKKTAKTARTRRSTGSSKNRTAGGHGSYWTTLKTRMAAPSAAGYTYSKPGPVGRAGRAIGQALGARIGGAPGAAIGQAIGGLAHYAGKIFGSGSYQIGSAPRTNSLFKGSGYSPSELSFGDRAVYVKHREYIGTVRTNPNANTFTQDTYFVNPGLKRTFPWLSNIAQNFQAYQIKGMLVEFVSTCSPTISSTTVSGMGSVIIAPDYNYTTLADPFYDRQEMLSYAGAVETRPGNNMICGLECSPAISAGSARKYIRNDDSVTDYRDTDLCSFTVATSVSGYSAELGDLYVIYDIVFIQPAVPKPLASAMTFIAKMDRSLVQDINCPSCLSYTAANGYLGVAIDSTTGKPVATNTIIANTFGQYSIENSPITVALGSRQSSFFVRKGALRAGQRYVVMLRYSGPNTSDLGAPNPAIPTGTQVNPDYFDHPVVATGTSSTLGGLSETVFIVDIVDSELLETKYDAVQKVQVQKLFSVGKTGVTSANQSIPITGSYNGFIISSLCYPYDATLAGAVFEMRILQCAGSLNYTDV